jgi:hypothetical protein
LPRYFFHIRDGVDQPDLEGTELSGPDEAREMAVVATGEALKDLNGHFWEGDGEWRMTVTDWRSTVVCVLNVSGERRPLA